VLNIKNYYLELPQQQRSDLVIWSCSSWNNSQLNYYYYNDACVSRDFHELHDPFENLVNTAQVSRRNHFTTSNPYHRHHKKNVNHKYSTICACVSVCHQSYASGFLDKNTQSSTETWHTNVVVVVLHDLHS